MVNETDYNIVARFGAEYRGIVQYYLLASDVFRLHRLRWVMETSMLNTLAGKHRSTVTKMAARHKAKIQTPHGLRTRFEARSSATGRKPLVAWFGGIPLKRQKTRSSPTASTPGPSTRTGSWSPGCSRADASSAGEPDGIQVHHVRALADLNRPGQPQPRMGAGHGEDPPQVPRGLRRLPRPHPRAPRHTAHAVDHRKAGYPETGPSGSEGGRAEKDQPTLAPRRPADPTQTLKKWLAAQRPQPATSASSSTCWTPSPTTTTPATAPVPAPPSHPRHRLRRPPQGQPRHRPPTPTTTSAPTASTPPAPSPSAPTAASPHRRRPTHAGTHVLLLIQDLHIRIINAATGELLRQLTLDPTATTSPPDAHPKAPRPNKTPRPSNNTPNPNAGSGCPRCLETSHW